MDSRQRVVMAINHSEPDRVPLDFGATGVTGIHARAYGPLRAALDLPPVAGRISDVMQQLAALDEDFVERLAVDVRGVGRGAWDNLDIQQALDARYYRDDFGITWSMVRGRLHPAWRARSASSSINRSSRVATERTFPAPR